ncbi:MULTISPECIES: hypothetical protein [unclassified Streptomyces]|uniref:hypothetical protein n=1 Tax=unclassified Streptomyces TaxID=2593676 RepID=UPI00105C61AD|nr:hypothetical protein [Streptomyces sp. BK208]TDT35326.1 hypothetical protein EV562_109267 [Streptomyces sp. BK208]
MTEHTRKTARQGDKERQIVVSVRFPEPLLQKVNAYADVVDASANAVIREAVEEHIRAQVRTPEFQRRSKEYLRRAQEQIAVLEDEEPTALVS